ncbi:hypothetical protein ABIB99_008436 [Bradyrhizobium sp. LA6.1]|uniref:hypothetical protein n=1 Tax=Bradyrhizobium sp. LA6.1 TaxID=3156378 RepID=UPI00339644EF
MLGWIVRILFVLAAPVTALFIARDALNSDRSELLGLSAEMDAETHSLSIGQPQKAS